MADDVGILAPNAADWTPPQPGTPTPLDAGPPSQPTPPVDVNAAPPSPVDTVNASQSTMLDPEVIAGHAHQSWLARILDAAGTILGGDKTVHVTKHTDGSVSVTQDPSTMGEKWGRVAAAVIGGAAKGFAAGQGPGGAAKAVGAGYDFGQQQSEQRLTQANAQANAANAQLMAQANHAMLDQQIIAQQFNNRVNPIKFAQEQTEYATNIAGRLHDQGGTMIAHVKNMQEAATYANSNPTAIAAHMGQNGYLVPVPNADGSVDIWQVPNDTGKQKYMKDSPYQVAKLDPDNPGKVLWETHVTPGGTYSNSDLALRDKGQLADNNKIIQTAQERGTAAQEAQTRATEAQGKPTLTAAQAAAARGEAALHQAQAEAAQRSLTGQPGGTPVEVDDPNFPSPANFPTGTPGIAPPPKSGNYVPAEAAKAYRLSQIMRESGQNIRNIATANPQLFGRLQGLLSEGKTIVGLSSSADDQNIARLAGAIQQYAQASAGFHTFRNKAAPAETEESSLNKFRNDPASIVAYLDSQRPAFDQTDRLIRNYEIYHTPDGPSADARAAAVARAPNAAKFQGGGGAPAPTGGGTGAPTGAAVQAPPGATTTYHDNKTGALAGWAVGGKFVPYVPPRQ